MTYLENMMKSLHKDGKTLFYKVIEKPIKHTYIKVEKGFVLIKKSKTVSLDKITNYMFKNFDKYYQKTKVLPDNILKLWGKEYQLEIIGSSLFSYEVLEDTIIVKTCDTNLNDLLEMIYKMELEKYLLEILPDIEDTIRKHGLKIVPIELKLWKSKFGTYYLKTNKIRLNIILASLDKTLTTYTLYHEYAHQKYPHHQASFYRFLEKLMPNYKTYDTILKQIPILF